jgi:hypothetical protein
VISERDPGFRRRAAVLLLLLPVLLASAQRALAIADPGPIDEYQVKAAFLANFAYFVEWPPSAFESPTAPLIIGIVGEDPFGDGIDRLVEHKVIAGHQLQVRRFADAKAIGKSHLLFVAGSDRQLATKVLDIVRRTPVMTVGESEGFAQAGGVCNFTRTGARIGFEINVSAASRAGLSLSSRLLALARIVREEGEASR